MQSNTPFDERPPLWLYHEHPYYQWRRPEYYNLCLETVQRHCGRTFRIIPLTRDTVYNYLPNLRKDLWVTCTAEQRTDLVRWELLARYGGLCLDPGVLVTGDLTPYMRHLEHHDAVVFGCGESGRDSDSNDQSQDNACPRTSVVRRADGAQTVATPSPTRPATWAMASRPQGMLANYARSRCHWLLDNDPRHVADVADVFGPLVLWQSLADLLIGSSNDAPLDGTGAATWSYVHVGTECGSADARGKPYMMPRFLRNEPVDAACLARMRLVPLHGNRVCDYPVWFVEATREQLLGNPNTLVGKLWRWSLTDETPFPAVERGRGFQATPSVTMPRYYASSSWAS